MKPKYSDLGMAVTMGPMLKQYVENELLKDLRLYNCISESYSFDWSESCIEGRNLKYLDGSLDRFSGIKVFDVFDSLIAEGWMEFIYMSSCDKLFVYWEYLDLVNDGDYISVKSKCGIPQYIYEQLDVLTIEECKRIKLI